MNEIEVFNRLVSTQRHALSDLMNTLKVKVNPQLRLRKPLIKQGHIRQKRSRPLQALITEADIWWVSDLQESETSCHNDVFFYLHAP